MAVMNELIDRTIDRPVRGVWEEVIHSVFRVESKAGIIVNYGIVKQFILKLMLHSAVNGSESKA